MKVICSNCGSEMELIGITDKQAWKYYCSKCYKIIEKERKVKNELG